MKLHDVYKGAIQILYYTIMGRGFGVACKFAKMVGRDQKVLKLCTSINISEKFQISFTQ